jgi:hypothetical protein
MRSHLLHQGSNFLNAVDGIERSADQRGPLDSAVVGDGTCAGLSDFPVAIPFEIEVPQIPLVNDFSHVTAAVLITDPSEDKSWLFEFWMYEASTKTLDQPWDRFAVKVTIHTLWHPVARSDVVRQIACRIIREH